MVIVIPTQHRLSVPEAASAIRCLLQAPFSQLINGAPQIKWLFAHPKGYERLTEQNLPPTVSVETWR